MKAMAQNTVKGAGSLGSRFIAFACWCAAVLICYSLPLSRLIRESLEHGYSSHIVLVPTVVAYLIWFKSRYIFAGVSCSRWGSAAGVVIAVLVLAAALLQRTSSLQPLLTVLSVLLWLLAGFVGFFGMKSLRAAIFPASLLLFMIPVPGSVVDTVISFLQVQSADLSHEMFKLLGIPVFRDGFVLTLAGATIQVAEECSGINSSIALLILMIVFSHQTLESNWRRVLLILLTIPLSILKNAIRIVTLTVLAVEVDPAFLTGRLHHEGGFVFFLITLALVYPIWKLLRSGEKGRVPLDRPASLAKAAARTGN